MREGRKKKWGKEGAKEKGGSCLTSLCVAKKADRNIGHKKNKLFYAYTQTIP